MKKNPQYKCIVTAHNLDDNLETVIFNFARGTGPKGLIGINAKQGNIFRPLITASKKEIIEYCNINSISYVEDSTNTDTAYTRNHIRHNIIPQLEKINPEIKTAVCRLGDILSSDEAYLNGIAYKIIKDNQITDKIPTEFFNSLEKPIKARLLKIVFGKTIDYTSLKSCIELASKCAVGSYVNLPNGISFKVEHSYLHFVKTDALCIKEYNLELKEGLNKIDAIDKIIAVNCKEEPKGYILEASATFDSSKIKGTLTSRQKTDGDRIFTRKMTKTLKSLFLEKHIPSHLRTQIPLVLMDGEIIYVPKVAMRDDIKGKDFKIKVYTKNEGQNE